MGAKTSKTAQSATRRFPTRAPGAVPPPPRPGAARARASAPPISKAEQQASLEKDEAILADGADPDRYPNPNPSVNPAFSQRLKQMGVATPNPTLSNSSTAFPAPPTSGSSPLGPKFPAARQNQTLNALEARKRLQEEVELQLENPSGLRDFADAGTLRQALIMRRRGLAASDVEKRLRLSSGVVARIESGGVITPLGPLT
ncbi:hypothetical protein BKA67DRAFT_532964 [Truncatella angustata]|uniref:Helix-turn-helix domain-containing protein n=1 Tax=Truncatella angustata TaxID=152316 RepID=A0A9P8UT84_9PEZI|nr:uncharacterized protein BKA67DRAFT_532964 [Truncatella angustata]KAH6657774.1 hypothetical protein BKA67DRAFT_532964 [Truncatella angustata]